jgi:hypothetical protein
MRFYHKQHRFYAGGDLHARSRPGPAVRRSFWGVTLSVTVESAEAKVCWAGPRSPVWRRQCLDAACERLRRLQSAKTVIRHDELPKKAWKNVNVEGAS